MTRPATSTETTFSTGVLWWRLFFLRLFFAEHSWDSHQSKAHSRLPNTSQYKALFYLPSLGCISDDNPLRVRLGWASP